MAGGVAGAIKRIGGESREQQAVPLPGMGTGVGGIQPAEAVEVVIRIAYEVEDTFESIFFIDCNKHIINAWKKYL